MATGNFTAIAYVQHKLRGGIKRAGIYTGLVVLLLGGFTYLQTVDSRNPARDLLEWADICVVLGGGVLVIGGLVSITSGVRNDVTGGMIESHRLMPVTGAQGILGYVVGGLSNVLPVGLSIFGLALACKLAGGGVMQLTLTAVAVLLTFSAFVWMIAPWAALAGRGAGAGMLIGTLIGIPIMLSSAATLPQFGLILTPFHGDGILDLSGSEDLTPYLLGMLFQGALGLLLLTAAGRRFTEADAPLVGLPRMLAVQALWLGATAVTLSMPETYIPYSRPRSSWFDMDELAVAGTMVALVIAAAVCTAAVTPYARPDQRRHPGRGRLLAAAAAVGCVLLTLPILLFGAERISPGQVTAGVIVTLAVAQFFFIAQVGGSMRRYRALLMFVWLIAVGVVPLIVEGIVGVLAGRNDPVGILVLSPFAAVALTIEDRSFDAASMITQACLLAVVAAVATAGLARGRRKRADPGESAAAAHPPRPV